MNNQREDFSKNGIEAIQISANFVSGANRQIIGRVRDHTISIDFRKERGGDDSAPSPPEFLMVALGGCIFNFVSLLSAEKGVDPADIRINLAGRIDPAKAFGLKSDNRAGFLGIYAKVEINGDLKSKDLEHIKMELEERCALCDTVRNPTILNIEL